MASFHVAGVDVTSAPRRGKPITMARGRVEGDRLAIIAVDDLVTFDEYRDALRALPPSLVAIDHPFGLPRAFLEQVEWTGDWRRVVERGRELGMAGFIAEVAAFRDGQAVGSKHPLRAIDLLAGSASPVNVVNPPVGRMWQTCAPILLEVDADVRPVRANPGANVTAIEGYAALVAQNLVGTRAYKSESAGGDTAARRKARHALIEALGQPVCLEVYGVAVTLPAQLRLAFRESHKADRLDAVLCAVQAAWAGRQPGLGIPADADPLEGWTPDPITVAAHRGRVA